MNPVVEVKNITKLYGDTVALENISLSLVQDRVYGLLGRNGAGKTTLMQLMAGQLLPSAGAVRVSSEDIYENNTALSKIRYFGPLTNLSNYVKTLKVKDFIKTASQFYPDWDQDFADELLRLFSLDLKKSYKNLSSGMLSMVSIVISLASRTPVTLLDEPYTGLDAAVRQEFYDILAEDYASNPRTIVFSTHLIDEASKLFEEVILLHEGKILLQEPLDILEESSFVISGDEEVMRPMLDNKRILHREAMGRRASYYLFDSLSEEEKASLVRSGLEIRGLTLQQLFVYLTARGL